MVHALDALKEAWRVLVPGGRVCEFHAFDPKWALAVVAGEQRLVAGLLNLDTSIDYIIDANEALSRAMYQGWFLCERQELFHYNLYWDTVEEMTAYYLELDPETVFSQDVLDRAEQILTDHPGARLCIRANYAMGCYQKLDDGM